jgi:hypothetical protein
MQNRKAKQYYTESEKSNQASSDRPRQPEVNKSVSRVDTARPGQLLWINTGLQDIVHAHPHRRGAIGAGRSRRQIGLAGELGIPEQGGLDHGVVHHRRR